MGLALAIPTALVLVTMRDMQAQTREQCPLPGAADIAAVVNGERITIADVDAHLGVKLAKVRSDEYALRSRALDELIEMRLLAAASKRASLPLGEIVKRRVAAPSAAEEDARARAMYKALPQRFGGMSEADAVIEIKTALARQRDMEARTALIAETATDVERRLVPFRVNVNTKGAPVLGAASAPIEIVEFSDFQCPYCARAAETTRQLVAKYDGRVRVAYRHFPLQSIHKEAAKAAEAASCAADQQKFWEMHDRMFANQQNLQVPALKQMASQLGLKSAEFDACLDSGKYAGEWQQGLSEGQMYGVAGTPTYFVNGRLITGAPTIEQFDKVIGEELALMRNDSRTTGRSQ